jgi:hypothetical protein
MPKQQARKQIVDAQLDAALRDTFPASDPVSMVQPGPVDDETIASHRTPRRRSPKRRPKSKNPSAA